MPKAFQSWHWKRLCRLSLGVSRPQLDKISEQAGWPHGWACFRPDAEFKGAWIIWFYEGGVFWDGYKFSNTLFPSGFFLQVLSPPPAPWQATTQAALGLCQHKQINVRPSKASYQQTTKKSLFCKLFPCLYPNLTSSLNIDFSMREDSIQVFFQVHTLSKRTGEVPSLVSPIVVTSSEFRAKWEIDNSNVNPLEVILYLMPLLAAGSQLILHSPQQ